MIPVLVHVMRAITVVLLLCTANIACLFGTGDSSAPVDRTFDGKIDCASEQAAYTACLADCRKALPVEQKTVAGACVRPCQRESDDVLACVVPVNNTSDGNASDSAAARCLAEFANCGDGCSVAHDDDATCGVLRQCCDSCGFSFANCVLGTNDDQVNIQDSTTCDR
jgi:hypothetical protein